MSPALTALQAASWKLRASEAYRKDGKGEDAQRCKAEALALTQKALDLQLREAARYIPSEA